MNQGHKWAQKGARSYNCAANCAPRDTTGGHIWGVCEDGGVSGDGEAVRGRGERSCADVVKVSARLGGMGEHVGPEKGRELQKGNSLSHLTCISGVA